MELQRVEIAKTDTCLTYVLKRIGFNPDMCTYETINEHFHQIPWSGYKRKELPVGAILLWDKTMSWKWMPTVVTENGKVISRNVPVGFHFAVYEGEGFISDCTRLQSAVLPHPSLRYREMSSLKSNPDWVLLPDNKEE